MSDGNGISPELLDKAAAAFSHGFRCAVQATLDVLSPQKALDELEPAAWGALLGIAARGMFDAGASEEEIFEAVRAIKAQSEAPGDGEDASVDGG